MHIKQKFLNYFENKNHKIIPSFSLIPLNDPSLLLINAGMAPMKKFFLGQATPPNSRVANCQKCIRAGGKHNDLDDVGYTKRHHTFFEMLGNFSFGDYAHEEAINMAWDFLTNILNLSPDKLYITVHPDDTKSREIWKKIPNLIHKHIVDENENEWSAGEEGPCGVCTEIFYDHGDHIPGNIIEGDRFVEIWNIVFMTHTVLNGIKIELEKPCVDAGMGLERVEALYHGTNDNYEAPFFAKMIDIISVNDSNNTNNRVIADHSRSITFMIDDGIIPEPEGAGYILRKIIRRAVRRSLNNNSVELCIDYIIKNMSDDYPSLLQNRNKILNVFKQEKEQFLHVYYSGIEKLNEYISQNNMVNNIDSDTNNVNTIDVNNENGKKNDESSSNEHKVFELYDTYGFPYDISFEILREKNIQYDFNKFEQMLNTQKTISKLKKYTIENTNTCTPFVGYEHEEIECNILEYREYESKEQGNDKFELILLDQTPFYVESGGQKHDIGQIITSDGVFEVYDMQKDKNEIWHIGKCIAGKIKQGKATAKIDSKRRKGLKQHHTATHILLAILRQRFGDSVLQKGSSVKEDGLRLDFSMNNLINQSDLKKIAYEANQIIQNNFQISTKIMNYESAIKSGALITEKNYPNEVRVLTIDNVSTELCCGTHVSATGEIGLLIIKSHKSISAGVKRIEAICGMSAVDKIFEEKHTDKNNNKLNIQANLIKRETINQRNIKIIIEQYSNASSKYLLDRSDEYISQYDIVILANDQKAFLVKMSDNAIDKVGKATEIMQKLGGKGGGRKNMAQGNINKFNIETITKQVMEIL
ncbi:alanine--tRNA ligase [Candidatus Cytomitobacter primus]|uniref:Alanine--tRNA ligase n=1 Tax=Candidatus Cytomitobacter primus TaxID=2066024 RepID=A0A5C0UGB3_9PROT|nr:alanine--tRNA ligase [Candidatus Cytomitobacter primus]QEK38603.1 alanine--tRNA ligase [Candidatus Cytomitobacter primus]